MVYDYVSAEAVIAQFINKTRLSDTTYADSTLEWLREAMNMMRIRNVLTPTHACIDVVDHIATLPCGIVMLDGVFHNGQRLRTGLGATDTRFKGWKRIESDTQSYFQSDTSMNAQDYELVRGADLKLTTSYSSEYYIPAPKHFQCSFSEGTIVVCYRKMPVDKKGYPLVPDEENIRQAIFWWLMASITLSGFKHQDSRMDFDYCERKFLRYKRKGLGAAKYWSVDKREAIHNLINNLIPPTGYYDMFFIGGETPKYVGL